MSSQSHEVGHVVYGKWDRHLRDLRFDEAKAREQVKFVYRAGGLRKPKIVILDSPLAVQFACNQMPAAKNVGDHLYSEVKWGITCKLIAERPKNKKRFITKVWLELEKKYGSIRNLDIQGPLRYLLPSAFTPHQAIWCAADKQLHAQRIAKRKETRCRKPRLRYHKEGRMLGWADYQWVRLQDYAARLEEFQVDVFNSYKALAEANVFSSVQLEGLCLLSRPPIALHRNQEGRLHSVEEPAIRFRDGFHMHYVHGLYFTPQEFAQYVKGQKAKGREILQVPNAEQQAALIRVYGYERILNDLEDVKTLDTMKQRSRVDRKVKEYALLEFALDESTRCRVLKVVDHSSDRTYFLRVPAQSSTSKCKAALAWTFGVRNYAPLQQS